MRLVVLGILAGCSRYEFQPPPGTTTTPPDIPVDTVDTALDVERVTSWDCYGRAEVDSEGDGRVDYVRYEVYDPDHRDRKLHEERDVLDDGRVEWNLDLTWDEEGRLLSQSEDSNGDGLYEEVVAWQYDEQGNLVEEALDADGDGLFDEIWRWTWDTAGLLILEEVDLDGDEVPDEIREWMHAGGLAQTMLEDTDADGTVDLTYTYTYDASDVLQRIEGEAGDGPPLEYLETWEWPGPHHSIRRVDYDGDGVFDEVLVEERDEQGLLLRQDLDYDGDGHDEYGWHDIVWDDRARFVSGLLYVDIDDSTSEADIWSYENSYANPVGPWYRVRLAHYQGAWDEPVAFTSSTTYDWYCP